MRLCADWNPAIEHLHFGVEGLALGEMVQTVDRLRELDGYEGLQFASPDHEDKMARVIDTLTGAPVRQRLKFEPGGTINGPQHRKMVRWFDQWKPSMQTLIVRGTRLGRFVWQSRPVSPRP